MKHLFFTVISAAILLTVSCKNETSDNNTNDKTNNNADELFINPTKTSIKVADSIMYITNVKNPNPEDSYYMSQWLSGAKTQLLADLIFDAVYDKRIKAYNYITGKEMSIDEIKDLENKYKRENIGQILYTEDWYFDEKNLKMYKQVNSIMLAYFRYDEDGNLLGNHAGIRIYLNGTKPMRGAQDY